MFEKLFTNKKETRTILSMIVLFFIMILLKAYVVQMIYNTLGPKLVRNFGNDSSKFEPLNYTESLLMVILFKFLFR